MSIAIWIMAALVIILAIAVGYYEEQEIAAELKPRVQQET